ncbi:uncharacterized protein THITE_2054748 [Thermothielavioides terrestris NRRL 8126]|uniref:Uncharacterized protein n=1 Tax=Thermothielavioides terrestris (strain ATCC 38088 / NRRL 8126) TaxID=578455 RepID=G2RAY9_THETT|nr:uncharacterized protein THITE_2054748 [Thermothielavioides terrestris NRRL 8126]AEO68964.1 hypothetical protein THITE_2054748 [Thermothielavioides terrestris NRRL 8126]
MAPQALEAAEAATESELRFPPVTRDHILHCSYDYWFPKYRTSCIRSIIIPLTPEFVDYLRADGIILADDEGDNGTASDSDFDSDSDAATDAEDEGPLPPHRQPPNRLFPSLHAEINKAIAALGGAAAPKLNWSSPKDATFISRHPNTMKCTTANDVYLLLKSSNFITHDLDHAFDDTTTTTTTTTTTKEEEEEAEEKEEAAAFRPVLVLRAFFSPLPSLEFRCFVAARTLLAISQRDHTTHYAFLPALRRQIVARARELFRAAGGRPGGMQRTFPDDNFVFDVYIPEAEPGSYDSDEEDDHDDGDEDADSGDDDEHLEGRRRGRSRMRLGRARLIDVNPWAPRTDALLFGWEELLRMAREVAASSSSPRVRGRENGAAHGPGERPREDEEEEDEDEDEEETDDDEWEPEVRLVLRDDPAATNFMASQYSAHKLPKDVVDASLRGEDGVREFAQRWQRITEGLEEIGDSDDDGGVEEGQVMR